MTEWENQTYFDNEYHLFYDSNIYFARCQWEREQQFTLNMTGSVINYTESFAS